MMMKKIFFYRSVSMAVALVLGLSVNIKAQDWQNNIPNDSSFYSVQKAWYSDPDHDPSIAKTDVEDGPDEQFKRWEHFMITRVDPQGKPVAPDFIYKEWARYQATHAQTKRSFKNGDWTYTGPNVAPGSGGGTGRINCICFMPGNPKTMWAGTPSGGLWKSTDIGNSWSTNTDNLPSLGVTDIAINTRHTDTMFIATGDGFGFGLNNGTYRGGYYSNGVMRSIDGGLTWDTTGLNWSRTRSWQIYRLIIYPENPNILIALTSTGIWRTTDAGNNWNNVLTTKCTDIKMNEKDHYLMYAGGSSLFISKDTGESWQYQAINFPVNTGAMTIATTPANDSVIYLLLLNGYVSSTNTGLMRSNDRGKNWNYQGTVNVTKFQGYYDAAMNISPVNANEVILGGLNLMRSINGGSTFSQISYDYGFPASYYVHPDHRVFEYYPGSKDTIFNGNDGGLYRSTNGGTVWKLISNDIHALEFYRIGSDANDPTITYAGAQDNGVNQMLNGNWNHTIGGDGMTCQASPDDPNIAYGSWQSGNIQKTINQGKSWSTLSPPSAGTVNWTAPFVLDPINSNTIYFGGARLYKSDDGGVTWASISNSIKSPANISNIAVAPMDNQTIYISLANDQAAPGTPRLYTTNDGGTTWNSLAKGLTSVGQYMTWIAVDRRDPKHIAITFSGYTSNQKIFESKDGGATYTNLSAGLPNLPANCVAFECSNENGIFIGTDAGVFYRNDQTKSWTPYNNGLPIVIISQLEVFPALGKIRAATYGRGVWDGILTGTISGIEKMADLQNDIKIYPNPSTSGLFTISLPTLSKKPKIDILNLVGQKINISEPDLSEKESNLDLSFLKEGIYLINFNYPDGTVSKKVQIIK